ncbi:store-operated calcium entry regulator STIMATE isoform X1 [Canis lupus familiaris]|uniref:store-operated calcium entry regulator STIMATE isoform X1 n=1 Tax=Canis lupus familiaris TaxID=9615 RepID=UPI0018F7DD2E|nr:store-operated calcium entry regulator STIMATE isoform X1 [Canis lupus familiaris]
MQGAAGNASRGLPGGPASTVASGAGRCESGALMHSFGIFLQGLLGVVAFSTLMLKRFREPKHERRPWRIWFLDTSKQAIGMLFIHFANVYLADLTEEDPCSLYLINFLLDATVGMLLIYVGVRAVSVLVEWQQWESLRFGEYGDPLQCGAWVGQCALYIVIMIFEKSVVFIVLLILQWKKVALLNPIENPDLKLAIVMLIVPFFVNALMFWVVDNFLMRKGRTKAKLEERGANQDSRNGSKVRYRRAASHEESESEVGPSPSAAPRPEDVSGLRLPLVLLALSALLSSKVGTSERQEVINRSVEAKVMLSGQPVPPSCCKVRPSCLLRGDLSFHGGAELCSQDGAAEMAESPCIWRIFLTRPAFGESLMEADSQGTGLVLDPSGMLQPRKSLGTRMKEL